MRQVATLVRPRRAGCLLLGCVALLFFGIARAADGPTIRDDVSVAVGASGAAEVERTVEFDGYIAELGVGDGDALAQSVRSVLARQGAEIHAVDVAVGRDRATVHTRYTLADVHRDRSDSGGLVAIDIPTIVPVDVVQVNYPFDVRLERVVYLDLPGTAVDLDRHQGIALGPSSRLEQELLVRDGDSLVVTAEAVLVAGEPVTTATLDAAGRIVVPYALAYRPSSLHWLFIGLAVCSIAPLLWVLAPVATEDRRGMWISAPRFNRLMAILLLLSACLLLLLALGAYMTSLAADAGVQQLIEIIWPAPRVVVVDLIDLVSMLAGGGVGLGALALGVARRRPIARAGAIVLALLLMAFVLWVFITWLPLPEYVPFQLLALFVLGELLLFGLAIVVRHMGARGMREYYAG